MCKFANVQMCRWNGEMEFISTFHSLSHYLIAKLLIRDLAHGLGKIMDEVIRFFQPAVYPHHAVGLFIRVESFPGHSCAFGDDQRFMAAPAHRHANMPQVVAELLDFAYGIQFQEKGDEPRCT